jgi:hypothetical protein
VTGLTIGRQGFKRFSFISQRPDRLWGPPSLLSNGYRGLVSLGKYGRGVKLTIHLYLVRRLRMMELYLHSPIHLYAVVLNYVTKYKDKILTF